MRFKEKYVGNFREKIYIDKYISQDITENNSIYVNF